MGSLTSVGKNIVAKRPAKTVKPAPLNPGARSDASGKAVNNVILLSLPNKEYNLLRPHLEFTDLSQYEILEDPGEKIDSAHFLNARMVSLLALTPPATHLTLG